MAADPVKLLPVLYEASTDREQWMQFLRALSDQARARAACLIARDDSLQHCTLVLQSGADPEAQRQYLTRYYTMDAFYAYAEQRGFNYPGSVAPSHAFISEQELLRTEFCNEFLLKFDMFQHCFALFGKNGAAQASLSLIRAPGDQPFAEPELRVLRFLAPHVQQAIQLTERFTQLQMQAEARQVALDQIGLGVAFLDATGRILGCNDMAAKILQAQEGILISKGRIRAVQPRENLMLQRAIFEACQTGAGRGVGTGGAVLVVRRPPAKPLQVVVGPACMQMSGLPSSPAAVVFIHDLSSKVRPRADLLRTLYQLTPAESRLACLILDGKSAKEITALLGISKNTFKTQIQSIYSKTNVRRQSQLLRLLMYLPIETQPNAGLH